jgi:hypothetical protein
MAAEPGIEQTKAVNPYVTDGRTFGMLNTISKVHGTI